ncbi:MAG: winged helix-turn-helix domain-containing protein [Opitutaceae bacterium]
MLAAADSPLRGGLRAILERAGFAVREVHTAKTALGEIVLDPPELTVLALDLPDWPGLDVLRAARELSSSPVLAICQAQEESRRIEALDAGADDCLPTPFQEGELLARVRALLRRGAPSRLKSPITFGSIEIDPPARRVLRGGRPIKLTAREYALLALLVAHPDAVLTHRRILRELWGPDAEGRTHYLRTYMMRLRRKLGDPAAAAGHLQNESGVGYRFVRDP